MLCMVQRPCFLETHKIYNVVHCTQTVDRRSPNTDRCVIRLAMGQMFWIFRTARQLVVALFFVFQFPFIWYSNQSFVEAFISFHCECDSKKINVLLLILSRNTRKMFKMDIEHIYRMMKRANPLFDVFAPLNGIPKINTKMVSLHSSNLEVQIMCQHFQTIQRNDEEERNATIVVTSGKWCQFFQWKFHQVKIDHFTSASFNSTCLSQRSSRCLTCGDCERFNQGKMNYLHTKTETSPIH